MRKPILEIVDYYCGCPPQSALILGLIEGFEMACNIIVKGTGVKRIRVFYDKGEESEIDSG